MDHIGEEDLVLQYYGEVDFSTHLDACPECRESLRKLQASLNLMSGYEAPEPRPQLAAKVWQNIAPQIGASRRGTWKKWSLWLGLPALAAACLATAFFLGRVSKDPDGVIGIAYVPQTQVLRAQTAEHIERSKLVLLETVNNHDGNRASNVERAEELLATNRLLRRGALANGQLQIAEALDELERILVEIAHAPEGKNSEASAALRARIQSQGTLFRLAVVGQTVIDGQMEKKNEIEVSEE